MAEAAVAGVEVCCPLVGTCDTRTTASTALLPLPLLPLPLLLLLLLHQLGVRSPLGGRGLDMRAQVRVGSGTGAAAVGLRFRGTAIW